MAIEWRKSYEIGVEKIDEQHMELFSRANDFLEACKEDSAWDAIKQVLDFLQEYVVTHFKDEEEIQLSTGYPGYDAHKILHQEFIATFIGYKKNIEDAVRNDEWSEIVKINRWLVDWLMNHIGKEDKKIGKYVELNG